MIGDVQCGECRQLVPENEIVQVPLKSFKDEKTITAIAYCCPYCDDVITIEKVAE